MGIEASNFITAGVQQVGAYSCERSCPSRKPETGLDCIRLDVISAKDVEVPISTAGLAAERAEERAVIAMWLFL